MPAMQGELIDELNTPENHENLERLRSYIWGAIGLISNRLKSKIWQWLKQLAAAKVITIGSYRIKGRDKYWSEDRAEGILRVLTCLKNQELEHEFTGSQLQKLTAERYKQAVWAGLKKAYETHVSIRQGAIEAKVAGGSYLNNFAHSLNHINY